jgi:hypothetical protein
MIIISTIVIGTIAFGGVKRVNPDLQEGAAADNSTRFDGFPFANCTCAHIKLLHEIHAWAWRNHNLKIQVAAMNRLTELGAIKPRPTPHIVRDDYDEEAEAQGVSVRDLIA